MRRERMLTLECMQRKTETKMNGRQIHKHDVQKITDCIEHPLSSSVTNVAELIKNKKTKPSLCGS